MRAVLASLALALSANGAVQAQPAEPATLAGPDEETPDRITLTEAEEARVARLTREIRCVACENEPISQSASEIAVTMRERVRSLVAGGASDAEVRGWFAQRYGEFVLFRPEADDPAGWLLWMAPFGLLIVGFGLGVAFAHSRRQGERIPSVPPEADDPAG